MPTLAAISLSCRNTSRRGVTLVELLVVVAIIGMILALLAPTVFNARRAAIDARTKVEVDLLHTALMNYRNEYGSLPPADMRGLWDTANSRVNTNHAAFKHLARAFPQMSEVTIGPTSPFFYMSQLSPAQALVFWLRGFYPNRQYPLTNGQGWPGGGAERDKLFDFDESRFYAVADKNPMYDFNSPQQFQPLAEIPDPADARRVYPVYFTTHANAGAPYVYFDYRCYNVNEGSDMRYFAQSRTGESSVARPYFTSTLVAGSTWSQAHINNDTFQLIAPGSDGRYGTVSPVAYPGGVTILGTEVKSVSDTAVADGHHDNITNFAPGDLDGSARKATTQD